MKRDNNIFYGMDLDPEQKVFVEHILDNKVSAVFCDAKAGTGKTTVALGAANILVQHGEYNGIIYLFSPVQEEKQGYLPGSIEEKSQPYTTPLIDAMDALRIDKKFLYQESKPALGVNQPKPFISALPHTFLRGTNLQNKVIIVDEVQNFYKDELKKTLTRIHDNCKIIVIGHTGQLDLFKKPENSGFPAFMSAASREDFIKVCKLTTNHRGKFSSWADQV